MPKILAPVLAVTLAIVILGCGGAADVSSVPTTAPEPAAVARVTTNGAAPTATSAPAAQPSPTPSPSPAAYDSNQAMRDVFPGFSITNEKMFDTLEEIRTRGDRSLVPVLVEILRFMPGSNSRERIGEVLRSVTGQTFESRDWNLWMEWLGENREDFRPPSEYPAWKAAFYAKIDPRFAVFLRPGREFSRIDLTEIVWGGVRPDGIPDIRNPRFLEADDADHMVPDDRVFGLEINGDVRAYPLRIVNAHEMVNDIVGGEPVSLMW